MRWADPSASVCSAISTILGTNAAMDGVGLVACATPWSVLARAGDYVCVISSGSARRWQRRPRSPLWWRSTRTPTSVSLLALRLAGAVSVTLSMNDARVTEVTQTALVTLLSELIWSTLTRAFAGRLARSAKQTSFPLTLHLLRAVNPFRGPGASCVRSDLASERGSPTWADPGLAKPFAGKVLALEGNIEATVVASGGVVLPGRQVGIRGVRRCRRRGSPGPLSGTLRAYGDLCYSGQHSSDSFVLWQPRFGNARGALRETSPGWGQLISSSI